MTLKRTIAFTSLIALVGMAIAEAPMNPEARRTPVSDAEPVIGTYTKAWLELQKSGQMAEGEARPMDGEAADASYQRYLDSFKHPIPQTLGRGEATGADAGTSPSQ
jgi:hypothetical protein